MEQIFIVLTFIGGFSFLAIGLCLGNSVTNKTSELEKNIMVVLFLISILAFMVGLVGCIVNGMSQ